MTVYHNRVRTMERAKTLSMTTDVTVWQDSMEQIVITVYNFYVEGFFFTYKIVTHSMNSSIKFFRYRNEASIFHIPCNSTLVYMLRHFVTDTDECADNPCENNGTCVDLVNAYECICLAGFNDTNCSTSTILKNLLNLFFTCIRGGR